MERRAELILGVGAGVLGLMCVVMEAQSIENPTANPTLVWWLGSKGIPMVIGSTGLWTAIQTVQHALLPMAVVTIILAIGAYLHSVHQQQVGLVLLLAASAVTVLGAGVAIFVQPYASLLFVPAPLVGLAALMAGAASVMAISRTAQRDPGTSASTVPVAPRV